MTTYYVDPNDPEQRLQRAPERPRPEPDEPILGTEVVRGPLTILDRAVIMVALEYLAEDVDEDPDEFQPEALTWLRSTAAKIRSQPVAVADPIHLEE